MKTITSFSGKVVTVISVSLCIEFCTIQSLVQSGTVRFKQGFNRPMSGNVQVFYKRTWLYVEVSARKQETANVACQQMDFPLGGFSVDVRHNTWTDIWDLPNIQISCNGSEMGLMSCKHAVQNVGGFKLHGGQKLSARCYGKFSSSFLYKGKRYFEV